MLLAQNLAVTAVILGVIVGSLSGFLHMHTKPGSSMQRFVFWSGNISLAIAAIGLMSLLAMVGWGLWHWY